MMTKTQITKIGLAMVLVLCAGSVLAKDKDNKSKKIKTKACTYVFNGQDSHGNQATHGQKVKQWKCEEGHALNDYERLRSLHTAQPVKVIKTKKERHTGVIRIDKLGFNWYPLKNVYSQGYEYITHDGSSLSKWTRYDNTWSCMITGSSLVLHSYKDAAQHTRFVLVPPEGSAHIFDGFGSQTDDFNESVDFVKNDGKVHLRPFNANSNGTNYLYLLNNNSNAWQVYGELRRFNWPGHPLLEVPWACEREVPVND